MKTISNPFKNIALCSLLLTLALNLFAASLSFGADIRVIATVDKNRLTLEDTLQLSILIQGTQNTSPPELPSLPNFKIMSAGTSSSTQYINTQRSVSITHNYRLTPMNTGTFIIGPTRVRANGKTFITQPITVEVQKPSSQGAVNNKPAFVEAHISRKKIYVGEQLVYTFKLFHRVDVKNLNLVLPFNKTYFHKEELGSPKSYNQIRNGIQYHVQELSLALFPLKKGHYEIPVSKIELDLYHPLQSRSRDPFDQFFVRGNRVVHKTLSSQPLSLDVLPLPVGAPNDFKDLVGQFEIVAEIGKNELQVGDTTTLTITVSGTGNVKDISFADPNLENHFKVYPDKPEASQSVHNNQIRGKKVFKYALVPLKAGNRILPTFSISYFDANSEQYRIAKTPPITLTITPSATQEKLNLVQPLQQNVPAPKPEIEILGQDILPIHTRLDMFQSDGSSTHSMIFLITGFGSPIVLFFLLALLIKRQYRMKYDVAYYRRRNAFKVVEQGLKQISNHTESKDFARELSEILRDYIGNKLNVQGKAITANEVEAHMKKSHFNAEQAEATRKLLEKCETLQFAPITGGSTKELLSESENLVKILEKQS